MADLELDLHTVSIPDNHHVYKCFPGQSYRYYQSTIEQSAVFLDIHDLQSIGRDPSVWNGDNLLNVVTASREREEIRLNTRKPDRQRRSALASRRLDIRNVTLAMGLYVDAKPGDLIVVPAEGYKKDVYIGELVDTNLVDVEIGGDEDRPAQSFLARRVRWLAKRPKKDFDLRIIGQLQNPTAFFDVGRGSYEDIYRLVYENYIFGDASTSTFETSKEKFRNSDNLVVSLWFEYVIASGIAKTQDIDGIFSTLSLLDATSREWDHSLGEEMFININSPGSIAYRAPNFFPIVALSLWALSGLAPQAAFAQDIKVHIRPVTHAARTCEIDVEIEIREYLNTIGLEKWKDACQLAERMRVQAKMHAKSRVRKIDE